MAKLSKAIVDKANAGLHNGFEFDPTYFLMHSGEKTAVKRIKLDSEGNKVCCIRLYYTDEYMDTGKGYRLPSGRQVPTAHLSKEIKEGDFYHSFGLGQNVKIGPPQNRKLFKVIQDLTKELDEGSLRKMCEDEPDTLEESKGFFL